MFFLGGSSLDVVAKNNQRRHALYLTTSEKKTCEHGNNPSAYAAAQVATLLGLHGWRCCLRRSPRKAAQR